MISMMLSVILYKKLNKMYCIFARFILIFGQFQIHCSIVLKIKENNILL